MKTATDTTPQPAAGKTAQVTILKSGVRVGNHRYAQGAVISMDAAEVEIRTKSGEVEMIRLNP
jgi:hypothetical protein